MLRNKFLLYIGFMLMLGYGRVQGQAFYNRAKLDSVFVTGFYGIHIGPSLNAFLKTDFSDLRLLDSKGNAVPYIIRGALPAFHKPDYTEWKIVSRESTDSGKAMLVLENSQSQKIADLYLKLKNASVSRSIDLSGSEDGKHWYSILENLILEKQFITDDDCFMERIAFPLSSYHYYRISVYNGKNDPLNIVSVGRYSASQTEPVTVYEENPASAFEQHDSSNHSSYIRVHNPDGFHVSHIRLKLRTPRFFKRRVTISARGQILAEYNIASDSIFHFYPPVCKDTALDIEIYNGDNPPLVTESVSTSQEAAKLIAYLDSGVSYHLEFNNPEAPVPHYDLQQFRDSIPAFVPEIRFGEIEKNMPEHQTAEAKSFFKQFWVWPVIAVALITLLLFTISLSKELARNRK